MFDALTQKRPYKAAWPVGDAIAEIERQRGRQFDPAIVDAFLRVIERTTSSRLTTALPADHSRSPMNNRATTDFGLAAARVTAAGARGLVVGFSGGLDSAVVARLCQIATPGHVLGVILPCHSDPQDETDARTRRRRTSGCRRSASISRRRTICLVDGLQSWCSPPCPPTSGRR